MNFEKSSYTNRLSQLVPVDCYINLKKEYPILYLEKRMLKLNDDYQCVYWYSISFVAKEWHKVSPYERRKLFFDREIFRCKYIKLAKLELFFQILEYIFDNEKALFIVGDSNIMKLIEYLVYVITKVEFIFPIFFHKFELDRINLIKEKTSEMFHKIIDFKRKSYTLFFQIFYKTEGKSSKYNLDPGILQQIHSYTFNSFY